MQQSLNLDRFAMGSFNLAMLEFILIVGGCVAPGRGQPIVPNAACDVRYLRLECHIGYSEYENMRGHACARDQCEDWMHE